MKFSLVLAAYRIAWEPALLFVRALAALEDGFWPARWRPRERLGYRNKNVTHPAPLRAPPLWMHAASLGESKGLWAVAQALAARDPALTFVLTATTVEGKGFLAERVRAAGDETRWRAALAPLDHPRIVGKFLRSHDIRALVLFEVELWPHFIREARRAGKPVLWISARLTPRAWLRAATRAVLREIDWTLAQGDADAATLRRAGAPAVEAGADLRGLHYLREAASPAPGASRQAGLALVSVHEDELHAILPALRAARGDYPLFVFPRKMESLPAFRAALEPLGFELRSANPRAARQIADAFGLVGETLPLCRAAVIGGSFAPHGGHNLWEPLVAGVSMAIGPWHESQQYLVKKLAAAGLLAVTPRVPDMDALHSAPDRRPACRLFVQTEETLLNVSVEILRKRLAAFGK